MAHTIEDMTAKERLRKLVDDLSEAEAEATLEYAVSRRADNPADEWGDLTAITDAAAAETMQRLDEEERATLGGTISEVWRRGRHR
jgi:hypothetical protein